MARRLRSRSAILPPSVDSQMKCLTEKLDLRREQQGKIKPIMQELHDYTVKIMQNDSLSEQERLAMAAHRWCDLECKERSWQAGSL